MSALDVPAGPALDDVVHARVVTDGDTDIVAATRRHARALAPLMATDAFDALVSRVVARVHGLGPLEPLLADPDVTEVMVNAGREVWVERAGRLMPAEVVLPPGVAEQLIERVVAPLGLRIDRTSPVVDARLPDGSRVHAVIPPLAVDGACLTIRRFAARPIPLAAFALPSVVALLGRLVAEHRNLLVSGATSSGKTTLLNAIGGTLPADERVITIEDAAELRLPGRHVVRLEARRSTADGVGAVTIRDLVRAALRMRPDRLVVGEVRGGEALDMVAAMNTGHDGSLSTCHANSAADALRRVETMVLQGGTALPPAAVREQVHASIDAVIHVARRPDGVRRVVEVAEVMAVPQGEQRVHLLADDVGLVGEPQRPPRSWSATP